MSSDKKSSNWTEDEDTLLLGLVEQFGQKWANIHSNFPGKTVFQIKRRWLNKLNPQIKRQRWTNEEDKILLTHFDILGPNWKEISKHLIGRPPDLVKSRYHSTLKKRVQKVHSNQVFQKGSIDSPLAQLEQRIKQLNQQCQQHQLQSDKKEQVQQLKSFINQTRQAIQPMKDQVESFEAEISELEARMKVESKEQQQNVKNGFCLLRTLPTYKKNTCFKCNMQEQQPRNKLVLVYSPNTSQSNIQDTSPVNQLSRKDSLMIADDLNDVSFDFENLEVDSKSSIELEECFDLNQNDFYNRKHPYYLSLVSNQSTVSTPVIRFPDKTKSFTDDYLDLKRSTLFLRPNNHSNYWPRQQHSLSTAKNSMTGEHRVSHSFDQIQEEREEPLSSGISDYSSDSGQNNSVIYKSQSVIAPQTSTATNGPTNPTQEGDIEWFDNKANQFHYENAVMGNRQEFSLGSLPTKTYCFRCKSETVTYISME